MTMVSPEMETHGLLPPRRESRKSEWAMLAFAGTLLSAVLLIVVSSNLEPAEPSVDLQELAGTAPPGGTPDLDEQYLTAASTGVKGKEFVQRLQDMWFIEANGAPPPPCLPCPPLLRRPTPPPNWNWLELACRLRAASPHAMDAIPATFICAHPRPVPELSPPLTSCGLAQNCLVSSLTPSGVPGQASTRSWRPTPLALRAS